FLVAAAVLKKNFDGLFDRLEPTLGDLGLEPFFRAGLEANIHAQDSNTNGRGRKRRYLLVAPIKNSLFPSPPSIGDGMIPATVHPSEHANAAISSHTAACTDGSRTMPFFTCAR